MSQSSSSGSSSSSSSPFASLTTFQPSKVAPLFGADAVAGIAAAACVSPFVTAIDKSIIKSAAGVQTLKSALTDAFKQLFFSPHKFLMGRDFRIVWGVYAGTYLAANFTQTVCDQLETSSHIPKFIATSAANIFLCVRKDAVFAKMFGAIAPSKVPFATLSLFTLRDCLTIAAAFNAPALVNAALEKMNAGKEKNAGSTVNTKWITQIACPVGVQFFSTPIHLMALDMYNRQGATFASRLAFVRSKYLPIVAARCSRIAPAFGIGGIANTELRSSLHTKAMHAGFSLSPLKVASASLGGLQGQSATLGAK